MAIVIGGHVRSGTTLLRNLLNSHPDITLTMEFRCFAGLNRPFTAYARQLVAHWWRNRGRSFLVHRSGGQKRLLSSHVFAIRYLSSVRRLQDGMVDAQTVEASLHHALPAVPLVGDKMPMYVYQLDQLVAADNLMTIIVYRDCRDVASSTLDKVRGAWRQMPFAQKYSTAAKIAASWVKAVEVMERHSEKIQMIRYEELVRGPTVVLVELAKRLDIKPCCFGESMIHAASVGRHEGRLSEDELVSVMDIAGPTMARLGYLAT